MTVKEFHKKLLEILKNVAKIHGDNARVSFGTSYTDVLIIDVVTREILWDGDTLPEFTWKYFVE